MDEAGDRPAAEAEAARRRREVREAESGREADIDRREEPARIDAGAAVRARDEKLVAGTGRGTERQRHRPVRGPVPVWQSEGRIAGRCPQHLLEVEEVHPVPRQEEEAAVLALLPSSSGVLRTGGAVHVRPVLPAARIARRQRLHGGHRGPQPCDQGGGGGREVPSGPDRLRDGRRGGREGHRAGTGAGRKSLQNVATVDPHPRLQIFADVIKKTP